MEEKGKMNKVILIMRESIEREKEIKTIVKE
jgi:hypothetical protein